MKDAVYFDDYESISDTLLQLGQGCVLKMCITIGDKGRNGEKVSGITEHVYQKDKYINKDKVVYVKRKFFPYLAIEYKDQNQMFGKGSIMISHYDILGFQNKTRQVDAHLSEAFMMKGKNLLIPADRNFNVVSHPSDNEVTFSPTVIIYANETKCTGIRMGLNNSIYINMPMRTWKAFLYYIQTADLYGWGTSIMSGYMANIIGQNVVDTTSGYSDCQSNNYENGFKLNKPINKDKSAEPGFFDK